MDNKVHREDAHLFTDVVPSNANQVQDRVHVPRVVRRVLLRQNGNFQHLQPNRNLHTPQLSDECKTFLVTQTTRCCENQLKHNNCE